MVAIIPYCFLLYKLFVINKPEHVDLKTIVAGIFDRRAFIMAAFLIAGLFIGDMPLFLRFDEVKPYLLEQYNYSKMNQGHPGDVVKQSVQGIGKKVAIRIYIDDKLIEELRK